MVTKQLCEKDRTVTLLSRFHLSRFDKDEDGEDGGKDEDREDEDLRG